MRHNVHLLNVVRYPWKLWLNLAIFTGFGQACPGMSKVLHNKAAMSVGRIELFVARIYASMEATSLLCCFSWVWPGMPKVLCNDKAPIFLERVEWFCWFFASSYLHLVRYPLKLQKYTTLAWHCYIEIDEIVRCLKLQKPKTIWSMNLILCFHWSQKNMLFWVMTSKYSWPISLKDSLLLT